MKKTLIHLFKHPYKTDWSARVYLINTKTESEFKYEVSGIHKELKTEEFEEEVKKLNLIKIF